MATTTKYPAQIICHWCNIIAVVETPTTGGWYRPACSVHRSAGSRPLQGSTKAPTDEVCAKGDATFTDGIWTCAGCGKTFARSPNQHIYAARKRVAARIGS